MNITNLLLAALCANTFSAPPAPSLSSGYAIPDLLDADADGLPDAWETGGIGGVDLAAMGCRLRKKDMIVLLIPHSDVDLAALRIVGNRVAAFYGNLPITNLDGSRGINTIVEIAPKIAATDLSKGYGDLYGYMPANRKGIAHAFIVGSGTGGGGQTASKDWSGVSTNWPTIVHELGHQLGLSHEGGSFRRMCPTFASLMNYDYSYSYKGDANAIQFSSGRMASLPLNEERLSERLPFPLATVDFLTFAPYRFRVESKSPTECWIDWNRNGVLGEPRIRADINYGYASWLGGNADTGLVANSSPVLTNHLGKLYVAAARISSTSKDSVDDSHLGAVFVTNRTDTGTWTRPRGLLLGANGDPTMVSYRGLLFLAARSRNMVSIQAAEDRGTALAVRGSVNVAETDAEPWLVVDNAKPGLRLYLFLWFRSTKQIGFRKVDVRPRPGVAGSYELSVGPLKYVMLDFASSIRLTSQAPVCVVSRPVLDFRIDLTGRTETPPPANELYLTATKDALPARNIGFCVKLVADATEGWKTNTTTTFLSNVTPQTSRRISVVPFLLDSANLYYFYAAMSDGVSGRAARLQCVQQVKDTTFNGGYLAKRLLNEWELTPNAPHAIAFGTDIAHAYRRSSDAVMKVFVSLQGSGVESEPMGDTNEIAILTSGPEPLGIQGSLRAMRAYYGKPR